MKEAVLQGRQGMRLDSNDLVILIGEKLDGWRRDSKVTREEQL